jgi:hypothetical protein
MTTVDADYEAEHGPGVSDRKARANAENARHSTGPRTGPGKQKSSMNALKHGGFAKVPVAIPRGPFAEDTVELDEFIAGITDSLDPRDAVEREQARRIAMCCVRSRRLNGFEAEALGRRQPRDVDDSSEGEPLERQLARARAFRDWFVTKLDNGVDFEYELQRLQIVHEFYEGVDCFEPEPEANLALSASERIEWFIEHCPDRAELVQLIVDDVDEIDNKIRTRDAARSAGARAALADTDKVSVTSQRNSRELDQALRQYELLRKRNLTAPQSDATRNEPTDQAPEEQ